ncbi:MAG: hypothetical protein ACLUOI_05425 [Eisenbergiella sp.]
MVIYGFVEGTVYGDDTDAVHEREDERQYMIGEDYEIYENGAPTGSWIPITTFMRIYVMESFPALWITGRIIWKKWGLSADSRM